MQTNNSLQKGITLVSLIITIIIMLILAGVTVNIVFDGEGIIGSVSESKYKTELKQAIEEYEYFVHKKEREDVQFEISSLMIGKNGIKYNTKILGETENIYTILSKIPKEYADCLEVIRGELYYSNNNEKKIKWARELGLKINPYKIVDGVLLSSEENLVLMDKQTGTLVIPDSVISIGEGAFANVQGLKTIIIPANVKEIQKNAFNGNETLENVIFETKVLNGQEIGLEKIRAYAFNGCKNIKEINIPDTVTEIEQFAFAYCSALENIKFSKNITKISTYLLFHCKSLETINVPEYVTEIDASAFAYCSNLANVYIPKTTTTIKNAVFNGCAKLKNIEIHSENKNFAFEDGILFNANKTIMIYILPTAIASTQTTFQVPNTVTELSGGLINSFSQIKEIIIPASVTKIDFNFLFKNMENIEIDSANPNYVSDNGKIYNKEKTKLYRYYLNNAVVELEEGITSIENNAFSLCTNLEELVLPETLTTLENQALGGLKKLTTLSIGPNVSTIKSLAFYNSGLKEITIDPDNNYYTAEKTAIYNKDKTKLICVVEKVTEFSIPEGVTTIENNAFHNQTQLTKVTIPNTVTTIGSSFNYCTSLLKIEIPNSVKTINKGCFSNSNNLTEIIIDKEKNSISGSPWGCRYGDRAVKWKR